MNTHKNASLTTKGRARLVAEMARISVRTARKWQRRFDAEGVSGLFDRSSRPRRSPGAAIRASSSAPWPCGAPSA